MVLLLTWNCKLWQLHSNRSSQIVKINLLPFCNIKLRFWGLLTHVFMSSTLVFVCLSCNFFNLWKLMFGITTNLAIMYFTSNYWKVLSFAIPFWTKLLSKNIESTNIEWHAVSIYWHASLQKKVKKLMLKLQKSKLCWLLHCNAFIHSCSVFM